MRIGWRWSIGNIQHSAYAGTILSRQMFAFLQEEIPCSHRLNELH